MSEPQEKIRLGGMAMRNGILVHSFEHWAAAVRTPDGRIAMASGRKPELPEPLASTPFLRGVARMAEALYLLPIVRRRLPEARLPVETPGLGAALAGSAILTALARRSRLPAVVVESVTAGVSLVPALAAIRGSQLAGYHGAEHKAIGAYEAGGVEAAAASKEHDRCGSHLIAPMLAANLAGLALLRHIVERPGPLAGGAVTLASTGVAVELLGWAERHSRSSLARTLRRPGHALQRAIGTREPTADQLAVGEAALAEVLRRETGAG